jgi:hypothetical protein
MESRTPDLRVANASDILNKPIKKGVNPHNASGKGFARYFLFGPKWRNLFYGLGHTRTDNRLLSMRLFFLAAVNRQAFLLRWA